MEPGTTAKTILIVEDNVGLNVLLTEKIMEWGYATISVHSGTEALSWLNDHTPFLIILDYSLPDMNGHELLASWQLTNKPIPPFIVSTGQGDESIAVEMMKLGAMDYMVKNMYFLDKLPEVLKRIDKEIENENKRKWAEIELKNSEQKYREMADFLPVGLFETDLNGTITFINQTALNWLGTNADDFKNNVNIANFVADENREKAINRSQMVMTEKIAAIGEYTLKRKSGDTFPVIVSSVPIVKNKQVHGLRGTIVDITERKQAEIKLNIEQKRISTILATVADPIFVKDNDHRIVLANHAFCDIFGLDESAMIGNTLAENVPLLEQQHFLKVDRMVLDTGIPDQREETISANNITRYSITKKTRFIDESGNKFLVGSIHDITDRKKSEEELKELNLFNLQIINNAQQGIIVYDRNLRYLVWNPYMEQMTGIAAPEILGKHPKDFFPFLIEAGIIDSIEKALNGVTSNSFDFPFNIPFTGKKGWASDSTAPFMSSKGEIIGAITVVRDITDRKQAENALIHSHELMKYIIEHTNGGVAVFDLNMQYIYVSQRYLDEYKIEEKNIIGKSHYEIFPEIPERWKVIHRKALAGEISKSEKDQFIRESGRVDWTRWECRPWYTNEGKTGGIILYTEVITERVLMEAALRESERQLKSLFENAADAIFIADMETGIILDANRAAEHLLKKPVDKIVGIHQAALHPAKMEKYSKDGFRQQKEGITTDGSKISIENSVVCSDGTTIPVEILASQVFYKGKDCLMGTFRNISDRKQAELALVRSEETHKEMIANISDVIGIMGKDGVIKYKSPNIEKWFGWQPGDLVGTDGWQTVHPDDLERIQKEFFKLLEKDNSTKTVEYRYKCKNGTYKMIELTAINLVHDPIIEGVLMNYYDITDRKLAEEKIREKDMQFRKLSANVSDLIFQFTRRPDGSYCVPIASEGIKNIFGCTPEEVTHNFEPIARVIYPEDAERVINDIEYSANNLTYFTCEFRVEIPGKDIQWIYSKSTPEKLADGSITWYGFNSNITEKKIAELEIINTKNRLKRAQDIAHVGNWELDLSTGKIWASNEAFNIYGIENIDQYLPFDQVQKCPLPEYRPMLDAALNNLIMHKQAYDIVFQIQHEPTNEIRTIHSIAEVERDSKGNAAKVIGIIQDITEQKKLEHELRTLSNAIEQNPASIVITNTQGNIEYVNPKFSQLTGYSHKEVVGKNPRFLKTDYTSAEDYQNLWATISKGKTWQGEFCNKKKDGTIYWESAVISPVFNTFGKITHYVAVKEDITEKKETERKIMAAVIEGEERERNRFSRELHDGLGPLLSSIKLYFQWISTIENSEKKQFLIGKGNHNIDEAILTLREISNNLSPQSLNTFGLVSAVQNYIDGINQLKTIQISFQSNIEKRFSKNIEIALYRIILELITNCLKHANAKAVSLSLHYIEFAKMVRFTYNDNGKGFDLEKNAQILSGKGLLNINYRVSSMNGKINLKTSPGNGLAVTIEVPVNNNGNESTID